MTETPAGSAIGIGSRVTFPYGGSRRTGTVSDISTMPDGSGGETISDLIDIGPRKVFAQGNGVTPAGEAAPAAFDAVAEGVAYGRKRPRNPRRR